MRGCCERITVWRRNKSFEREVLPVLCSWRRKSGRTLDGTGFSERSTVTVIIPYMPGFILAPGDLLALGEHEREITGVKPYRERDIKAELGENITVVQRVSYNLQGRAGHLSIEGV